MANKEDQEALRLLVQYVSRAFYEPKYVVILDQLIRHPVLKEDDLAGRIGLQAKELNKLMAVLTNDRLVQVHRQNELKEGAQRSIGKQYYFIDYQHFCNVVKWRVAEMRRRIDTTLRNELDNKGYICPNCKATFSTLEADRLMDFTRGTFVCDQCATSPGGPYEVVTNEDAESVRGSKDRMERFNKQTRFIREGLKRSEIMVLPAFDVAVWIKNNVGDSDKQKQVTSDGLKIAGSGERRDDGISIMMSVDKDEATRRRERELEAEQKRQQNVMPEWHLKSTISNDLTALGIAANQQQQQTNGLSLPKAPTLPKGAGSSNSTILNGLGKARLQAKQNTTEISLVLDVKPVVDHTADFYDQYYAQLEAQSQAQSTTQTPLMGSAASSDFEEDRKPNVDYLDPVNNSRKRSRSVEDDGARFGKAARSNMGTPSFSRVNSALASAIDSPSEFPDGDPSNGDPGEIDFVVPVDDATAVTDEPMVSVGGQLMPFSKVTQEIADEKMSPEEYTAWYELLMSQ